MRKNSDAEQITALALAGEATGYVVIGAMTEAGVGLLMMCVAYWLETGPSFAHFVGRLTGGLGALMFLIAFVRLAIEVLRGIVKLSRRLL